MLDRDGNPVDLPDPAGVGETCQLCASLVTFTFTGWHEPTDAPFPQASIIRRGAPPAGSPVKDRQPFVRCGLDPPLPL
jgi:hypothetical protein